MSERDFLTATGISRDGNDKTAQDFADSGMLQMDPTPLPVWDLFSQSQLGSVSDAQTNAKPKLASATELPWLLPSKFCENSESQLPPVSELFGRSLNFGQSWPSSITMTTADSSPASDALPNQRSEFFLTFTGHVFDVDAMAFEFYEDKMEFENYDLVISMPGQESVLTTGSLEFFLGRLSPVPDVAQSSTAVEENGSDSEQESEFIEEKLEFEEHDLAMNMPGQESTLDADNFDLLCSKLIAWIALDDDAENAVKNTSSETQVAELCSPEGCKVISILPKICHDSITRSPASFAALGSETTVEQSSRHNLDEETNPTPVAVESTRLEAATRVVPVQATPVPSKSAPLSQQMVLENCVARTKQDNVSTDSVRVTTHVNPPRRTRKNIFVGFICAKIVKVFVTKFVLL